VAERPKAFIQDNSIANDKHEKAAIYCQENIQNPELSK